MNSKRYPPCTSTQLSNWSQIGILWQIFAFVKSAVGEMLKPFSNMWLGVLGQQGYSVTYSSTNVCGVEGSFVDISCTYSYPNHLEIRETFWFIKSVTGQKADLSLDSKYRGRVEYLGDNVDNCTLRIKDLKESDTAERYRFRFITNDTGGKWSGSEVILSLRRK